MGKVEKGITCSVLKCDKSAGRSVGPVNLSLNHLPLYKSIQINPFCNMD